MKVLKRFDGWLHGLYMACIAFPLYNIGAKYAIEQYQASPLVFLCFSSLFSSLFLLLFAGRGTLALKSIRTLDTWVFSFLNLAALSFGLSLLVYVSALQGSILIRLTSFVCFVIAVIMGQSTNRREFFFSMVAFSGIALLFMNLDLTKEQKAIALLLLVGASLCQALRQLLSEFHKTNIQAKSTKESARVAGVVSSVSALVLVFSLLFISIYQKAFGVVILKSAPDILDFFNLGTIICAAVVGLFYAGAVYSEFYASKRISAKYLSAMIALMPMFVLIYEVLVNFILSKPIVLDKIDVISLALLVLGNLGIAITAIIEMKRGKETELREKYIVASDENIKYAIELVKSTMVFTHNDIKETIRLLGIDESVIVDLLALEDGETSSLSKLQFHTINKNYYLGVSTKDSLTKINNRGALEQKVKDILYRKEKFSLCFIDLDKFKPINDIYGHDVGDEVLKHVADLMLSINPKGINGRNGGDEFIMICFDNSIESKVDKFREQLSKVFAVNDISIKINASIGIAQSDGKMLLDELIKLADEKMYDDKKSAS
ncbi:MAG: putative diguanylate cyclase YedQ [Proteobacteria bacterium]|nr:MAG: putative diguanylate cyclase YedQ [Pseudomonadota bacterium]